MAKEGENGAGQRRARKRAGPMSGPSCHARKPERPSFLRLAPLARPCFLARRAKVCFALARPWWGYLGPTGPASGNDPGPSHGPPPSTPPHKRTKFSSSEA
jgi:hypothetical protein